MKPLLLLFVAAMPAVLIADDEPVSAFRLKTDKNVKSAIDIDDVRPGTPKPVPKDAIPAIWNPRSVPADKATWVRDGDRVLGVEINGEARAYPLMILEVHEMVNDTLGGTPIAPNY